MKRLSIACFALALATTGNVSAQGFNPWGIGGQANPWLQGQGTSQQGNTPYYGPQVGTLPNGTPIHNPWQQYRGNQSIIPAQQFNLSVQYNTNAILNPSLYPAFNANNYNRFANLNYGYNNFGYNQSNFGYNGFNSNGLYPSYEREVGGFVSVNPQLAVNPYSGTVLNPRRGVAYTREGPFYRVPGTTSYSPWGNPIYGSGVYYNPFTGASYSPLSGVIAR